MKKIITLLLTIALITTAGYANRTKVKYVDYTVKTGDSLFLIAKNHNTSTSKIRTTNGLGPDELIHIGQDLKLPTGKYISNNDIKKVKHRRAKKKPNKKMSKSHIKKSKKIKGLVEYSVVSGDTVYTIAKKHHTTSKEVLEKNNLKLGSVLKINQVLRVPTNTYISDDKKIKTTKDKTNIKISKKKIKKVTTKKKVLAKEGTTSNKSSKKSKIKQGKINYAIEKGDTIYSIAQKHHTSTREILSANRMERGALIRVGQILTVPTNTYFTDEDTIKKVLAKQIEANKAAKGLYTVHAGDTLFSIAIKNHLPLKEIMKFNKLKVNSVLKIGQELKVKKHSSYISKNSKTKKSKKVKKKFVTQKHKIRKGDTLSKIAKKYKVSVKKLRALNGLTRKSRLKIGKKLTVRKVEAKAKAKKRYRVKKGDTVWLIAKKNHTTVKKIRALNGLTRKSKIRKGMILTVIDTKDKSRRSKKIAKNKKSRFNNALSALNGRSSRRGRSNSKVIRTAKKYLGKRYVWGAVGPNKFDCSGFTQYVIRKSKGVRIPRVSRKQAYYGKYVSRSNLRAGDLIFFDTSHRRRGYVNHVGIYIGGNKFIHASSARHRVVITSLNRPFYKARFKWGRRVN